MKKVVLLVLLSLLLVLPARAQSIAEQEAGILGAQTLTEGLDEEALERLADGTCGSRCKPVASPYRCAPRCPDAASGCGKDVRDAAGGDAVMLALRAA